VSTDKIHKEPPLLGFWPHEVVILALLGVAAFYYLPQLGNPLGPELYAVTLVAALGALAWRCREDWRVLPGKLFFFLLLAAWLLLFFFLGNATLGYRTSPSLYSWMLDIYTSPMADEQHGLLIPFVVLGLFWWKRKELVARAPDVWWPGIFLVALGLIFHLAGFASQITQLSVAGFFIGLYGLTGLLWGKFWLRASFFPFFLFIFSMPIGRQADTLTFPLRLLTSRIVEIIAHLGLAPELVRTGTQLTDAQHTFAYDVAAACSGIRSLVTLLVLTTIYGFVVFKSPWKRAVMMLAAIPVAILGNVVRLSFTIGVAEMFGQNAGKMVETNFGFITFAVALACIYFLAQWLEKSEPKISPPENPPVP
jgi:exosortase